MNTNIHKKAFTMIELVFVIVIMGIIGKFGVEFLAQAYGGFMQSKINNELQSNSAAAVEYLSKKLQYRIKDSVIARESNGTYTELISYNDNTAPIIEWIGYDIDGLRGAKKPYWSGIIDLEASGGNKLVSLDTNTSAELELIKALSGDSNRTMFSSAIYFVGEQNNKWGWDSDVSNFDTQEDVAIHPIRRSTTAGKENEFRARKGSGDTNTTTTDDNSWTGVNASELYQLSWTAYAVGIDDYNTTAMGGNNTGNLTLWYDYQPWKGHRYDDNSTILDKAGNTIALHTTKKVIIMENVSTFQFISQGGIMKIQVCVKSDLIKDEEYSLCKEKTLF